MNGCARSAKRKFDARSFAVRGTFFEFSSPDDASFSLIV